ncbi:MAG: hypothetical protein AAF908_04410, partial [Pseudomonadota bacterium]
MGHGALFRRLATGAWALAAAGLLAACAEVEIGAEAVKAVNKAVTEGAEPVPLEAASGSQINPRLEPAPEEFEIRGLALWDGTRTLQGVWVAHPEASTARRVRIFDNETKRAVDGALFQRDQALAGPSVLISSDAATLLGLRPNTSAELVIVALKPRVVVAEAEPAPPVEAAEPEVALATAGEADPVVEEAVDETEVAALEPEVEAEPVETPDLEAETPAVTEETPEEAQDAAPTEAEVAEEPEATLAAVAPEDPAPAIEPEAPSDPAPATVAEPATETTPEPATIPAPPEETETATLSVPQPQPRAPLPAPPEPAPADPSGTQYFVLAGVFGVKENADRLVARIQRAGYPARGG